MAELDRFDVAFVIWRVRKSPQGLGAPFLIDADTELHDGSNCMPLNKTNAMAMAALMGDDTEKWCGWGVHFRVVPKTLSGTRERVWGFEFASAVNPELAAKKRKSKRLPDEQLIKMSGTENTYHDVPF